MRIYHKRYGLIEGFVELIPEKLLGDVNGLDYYHSNIYYNGRINIRTYYFGLIKQQNNILYPSYISNSNSYFVRGEGKTRLIHNQLITSFCSPSDDLNEMFKQLADLE